MGPPIEEAPGRSPSSHATRVVRIGLGRRPGTPLGWAKSHPMPPRATTIAFDVMGSDHGPAEVVRGAAALSLETRSVHALLVGDRAADRPRCWPRHGTAASGSASTTRPSSWACTRSRPRRSGRTPRTPRSSSPPSWWPSGEADAVVSAGNTGAGVLACARTFQLIPGVRRAALASGVPDPHLARGEAGSLQPHPRRRSDGRRHRRRSGHLRGDGLGLRPHHLARTPTPRWRCSPTAPRRTKGPPRVVEAHAKLAQPSRASASWATWRGWTSPRAPPTSSAATASWATSA